MIRFLLSVLLIYISINFSIDANVKLDVDYQLSLEAHSDDEEETISILSISVADQLLSKNFILDYSLQPAYHYDHTDGNTDEQLTGNIFSVYDFNPNISWDFRGDFSRISDTPGTNIEDFNSQNIVNLNTGPVINIFRSLRGDVQLEIRAGLTDYEESNLDTTNTEVRLSYNYPFNELNNLQLSYSEYSLRYDDVIHQSNDSDISNFIITYSGESGSYAYTLSAGSNHVESSDRSQNQSSVSIISNYQINTSSTLNFEISDSVQNISQFNNDLVNTNNALFIAGVVNNQRVSFGYSYHRNREYLNLNIYHEEIENIFENNIQGKLVGSTLRYGDEIFRHFNFELMVGEIENSLDNLKTNDAELNFIYEHIHARSMTSRINLLFDYQEENSVVNEDVVFGYEFNYKLH